MTETSAGARVAERLYFDSPALTFAARVTDIQLVARDRGEDGGPVQLWRVALDRTAFYPEGGGQPWDTGTLVATARSGAVLEVPVERVEEDEAGEVWHLVRKPLVEGTAIEGRVAPARRLDHMQQHSGQHLLSAVLFQQLGARTVSFHLGKDSSIIDLALPEGKGEMARRHLDDAEAEINRLLAEDLPIRPRWYTRAEAELMLARGELRKLPDRTGPIRVVEMESVEWNACGGTHVGATGAIGGVLLRSLEKAKGGWRLEFVCGGRAARVARQDFALLREAASRLSVGVSDVPARVVGLQEEHKAAEKIRRRLLEELAEARAAELVGRAGEGSVVDAIFADKPVEFAKRVASAVALSGRGAVIGASEQEKAAVALAFPASDGRHAGEVLRAWAAPWGARGGGGPQLAQAVCEASQLAEFVRALVEHITAR